VPVAPAASCAKCSRAHELVTTVAPGSPGIPARDGFNSLFRALPGDRAFLSPSLADLSSANLTPASRRQDHTTSPSASQAHLVKSAARVHRIPCPTFVTIAKRPSVSGRDGEGYAGDLRQKGTKIFLKEGLDRQITEQPVRQNNGLGPSWITIGFRISIRQSGRPRLRARSIGLSSKKNRPHPMTEPSGNLSGSSDSGHGFGRQTGSLPLGITILKSTDEITFRTERRDRLERSAS
jgi:hypothetical protein